MRRISRALIFMLAISATYVSVPSASALTYSDSSGNCQAVITGTGATGSSAEVNLISVSSVDYCVVKFKEAISYVLTIPNSVTSVDYLVVGGGGGGGSGGGGGGGVLQGTSYSVTAGTNYNVTVGSGGTGGSGSGSGTNATNGGSSTFATITTLGGGSGSQGNQVAGSGSSGGGGRYDCTDVNSCPGAGTDGQGFKGGTSSFAGYGGAGGGGGASEVGKSGNISHIAGAGGNGISSSVTGTLNNYGGGGGGGINDNNNQFCGQRTSNLAYYCNGTNSDLEINGGGAGGSGGGGRGSSFGFTSGTRGQYANATAGTANLGGGGGGVDPEDSGGGAGGSGVVIIRYQATNIPAVFNSFSLTGSATTAIYRTSISINAEVSIASKVTFKVNGVVAPGCKKKLAIGSASSYIATCTWRPSKRGGLTITASAKPTSGSASAISATPIRVQVNNRTLPR
ncbi:MAG: hypothetical protein QNL78_01575 [Actinomycetes bacterium]